MQVLSKQNRTTIVNSTVLTKTGNDNIRLSYPIFELYGFKINIQPCIYGVDLQQNGNESILLGADMVSLTYKAGQIDAWNAWEIANYERKIYEYFKK
jgi:hypothetical protein